MFILAGADVNGRHLGCPPLFNAVQRGSRSRVELLLDAGADIDLQSGGFWTPLHEAVRQDNFEIVQLLLARGADQTIEDKYLGTPLDLAINRNCEEIIQLLQNEKKYEQD